MTTAQRPPRGQYQKRDKFGYALPHCFPQWPSDCPTRLFIGLNLNDSWYKNKSHYTFQINGVFYQVDKDTANFYGRKYQANIGSMPHPVPKEKFKEVWGTPTVKESKVSTRKYLKSRFKMAELFRSATA